MAGEHLQSEPQHGLVLTGAGRNRNILRVRCTCMAEYRNVSKRYYNYDWIAEVDSISEAARVYREHLAASA